MASFFFAVIVTTILASKFLNESVNILGKIGCFLTIVGATVVVLNAPKDGEIRSLDNLTQMLLDDGFMIYCTFVVTLSIVLVIYFSPRYGRNNVLVYIVICSVIGSLSVMCCKGIGLAITETVAGIANDFRKWTFWVLLISAVFTVCVQINYLNRSLDIFDASLVTPVYYVFFTGFVMVASSVLFKEWGKMSSERALCLFCGFFTIVSGLFLINAFKELQIDMNLLRLNRSSSFNNTGARFGHKVIRQQKESNHRIPEFVKSDYQDLPQESSNEEEM